MKLFVKQKKLVVVLFLILFFGTSVESSASSGPMHSVKGKVFYKWDPKKAAHFDIGFREQGEMSGCKLFKLISNECYWFFEAQHQVIGDMYKTFVRSAKEPLYCYQFKPRIIEKIKDEAAYNHDLKYEILVKTFGYLDAIEKWIYERNIDQLPEGWPNGKTVRMRIQELTGKLFNSHHDLRLWFKESERYLLWSNDKKQLVLNEKRKQNKQPYPERQYEKIPDNPVHLESFFARYFMYLKMHMRRTDDTWYIITSSYPMSRPHAVGVQIPTKTVTKYKSKIEVSNKYYLDHSIKKLKEGLSWEIPNPRPVW